MSEPKIYAEGISVFVSPVETERGASMGFRLTICDSESNAKVVAKRCHQFEGLVAALQFALPHARAAWMRAVNNAPQGEGVTTYEPNADRSGEATLKGMENLRTGVLLYRRPGAVGGGGGSQ